ncbi:unnamed protein product [Prunus armeniaca]
MAWKERGLIARNLTAKFEHEDESDEQSGYEEDEDYDIVVDVAINMEDGGDDIAIDEAINIEDGGDDISIDIEEEGDEGTVPEDINVDEEGDEGIVPEGVNVDEEGDEGTIHEGVNVEDETIYKEAENDKRAENENKESEEHGEDPEFSDSAYVQSEDEQCLLEKGDKTFDNYVDHKPPYIYPIADEGEKSDDMVVNDVNSFDSSSCDEVDMPMRKRKRKLPKFDDFKPDTDLSNPIFKLGLRFPNVYVFRKALRNYSVLNKGRLSSPIMIKIRLEQFVMGSRMENVHGLFMLQL